MRGAKRNYGWPEDAKFLVPDDVRAHFADNIGKRGSEGRKAWQAKFAEYEKAFPQLADEIGRMQRRELPEGWDAELPSFKADPKGIASRDSSGQVLNAIARRVPWLMGGAADLFPSTKTRLTFEGAGDFEADSVGRNFHFGIRENSMAAAVNGMSLSKVRPFGSGFLIFSDYLKPSLRLSGADGDPGYLCIHPRLHRSGRGRPHPSADRTIGDAALDSASDYPAAGRCQ